MGLFNILSRESKVENRRRAEELQAMTVHVDSTTVHVNMDHAPSYFARALSKGREHITDERRHIYFTLASADMSSAKWLGSFLQYVQPELERESITLSATCYVEGTAIEYHPHTYRNAA